MKKIFTLIITILILTLTSNAEYLENTIVVRMNPGHSPSVIEAGGQLFAQAKEIRPMLLPGQSFMMNKSLRLENKLQSTDNLNMMFEAEENLLRTYTIRYNSNISPEKFAAKVSAMPGVEIAEPVYLPKMLYKPNDPDYSLQSAHFNMVSLEEAWEIEKGDPTVIIGISDSGLLQDHEDMQDNLAVNGGEVPDNEIDDDGNGYTDDYLGYNFAFSEDGVSPGNTFNSSNNHGMNVAGIAGASTDNQTGIAGAGFNCKIFPIKMTRGSRLVYAYESIIYAATRGFKVLNMSWGTPRGYSDIRQSIIDFAVSRDVALVAAGGNIGTDNADAYEAFYPAGFKGVLGVGAVSNSNPQLPSEVIGWPVRVMAPQNIYTVSNEGSYEYSGNGTSFSAPVVSGVLGLVRSRYPELSAVQSIEFIRQCTDPMNGGSDALLVPGKLNARKAVETDPFSIPGIRIENITYTDTDGNLKRRNVPGDTIIPRINIKNWLGEASNLQFVLRPVTDNSNSIEVVKNSQPVENIAGMESLELDGFSILINSAFDEEIIFRLDITGENGYSDFIKFGFTPTSDVITFRNNEIAFSMSDNGEFGFSSQKNFALPAGEGFKYRDFGNQVYNSSGIMVASELDKIVMADPNNFRYDFISKKDFSGEFDYENIISDDAAFQRIGVTVTQDVTVHNSSNKAARIDLRLQNTSGNVLRDLAIGYFIDWDIAQNDGDNVQNYVGLLPEAIPGDLQGLPAVAEMASLRDGFPVFGAAVYSDNTDGIAQAAGLDYSITQDFTDEERIASLTSGTAIQFDGTGDVSMAIGMLFPGELFLSDSLSCTICIGAGDNREDLALQLANCLLDIVPVEDYENYGKLQIYPNPASESVKIHFGQDALQIGKITLFDLLGNPVVSRKVNSVISEFGMNIASINPGRYLVLVESVDGNISLPLIIER